MKKLLAILLAAVMLLGVVSFASAEEIKVAMITDYGDITDQSFNQTTYEAAKAFCEANGLEFQYREGHRCHSRRESGRDLHRAGRFRI